MSKCGKKVVNLKDHKNMMELLKQLYGKEEVKDDPKVCNTDRKTGTEGVSKMVKPPPCS